MSRWRDWTARAAMAAMYRPVMRAEGEDLEELHLGWFEDGVDSLRVAQHRYIEKLIEPLALTTAERVLDLGCGPGGVAVSIAARFGCRVDGVDLVPAHVARARAAAERAGLAARVRFHEADACRLPFAAGAFDRALSVEALYHVHPRAQVFAELARVVAPGGRLAYSEYVSAAGVPLWARLVCALLTGSYRLAEPAAATALLHARGFERVEVRDVSRDTLAGTWAWSRAQGHRDFIDYYLKPYGASLLKKPLIALTERALRGGYLRMHFVSAVRGKQ